MVETPTKYQVVARRLELIEALESGKYKQMVTRLRTADCFCIMGVACEVSRLGSWAKDEEGYERLPGTEEKLYYFQINDSSYSCIVPDEIRDYYDFSDEEVTSLVEDNDKNSCDFSQLAKRIREMEVR